MKHILAKDLKDSIIQYAMEGKLTEQLKTDSSVFEYVERIRNIKSELIKTKKIKRDKTTNEIDEYPFDIPEKWQWIKFGNLAILKPGKTPPRAESMWWGNKNEYPWVSIADMIPNQTINKTEEFISKKGFEEKFKSNISPKGTLIMSFKLTIGRVSILGMDALHNEAIISIFPFEDDNKILQKYLMNVLPYLTKYGDSKNAIKGDTLNADSLCNLLIPLPPIEEQKRIVEKIEELMAKINEYEKIENQMVQLKNEFPEDMKDAILRVAMEGKITKQNNNDKIIEVNSPSIVEEERFAIPTNWNWYLLKDLVSIKTGKKDQNYATADGKYNFYTCAKGIFKAPDYSFEGESLILPGNGANVGQVTLYNGKFEAYQRTYVLQSEYADLNMKYMYYCLLENWNEYNKDKMYGSATPYIKLGNLENYPIPLPPINEQQRIVELLDTVLPICDELQENI